MENNRVDCCERGAELLRELDNSQHADPGFRHVRAGVETAGGILSTRVRFCPWCGTKFTEGGETEVRNLIVDARHALDDVRLPDHGRLRLALERTLGALEAIDRKGARSPSPQLSPHDEELAANKIVHNFIESIAPVDSRWEMPVNEVLTVKRHGFDLQGRPVVFVRSDQSDRDGAILVSALFEQCIRRSR